MRFDGKVAIVTGAGGGIGGATACLLALEGARVVIADINRAAALKTEELVKALGGEALVVKADLGVESDIAEMCQATIAAFGAIDVLVNNAADLAPEMSPARDRDIETTPAEVWERALLVNVRGTAFCCKYVIPHMLAKSGGVIVNVASNLGLQGNVVQIAYSASKAAIIQMTRSIAASHSRSGIRCNSVSPGLSLSPSAMDQIPAPQREAVLAETLTPYLGAPDDIAYAIAYLASDESRYVTGHNLVVDGGTSSHVPGFERLSAL